MMRRTGPIILGLLTLLVPAGTARAADMLPDLGMAPVTEFRLERTADGRRLLRFSTTVANVGAGPFELRAASTAGPVEQVITDTSGTQRTVPTSAALIFGGDGHNHYHVSGLIAADLVRLDNGVKVGTSAKVGFCFYDTTPYRLSLPGAPSSSRFSSAGCGNSASTSVSMGLSVGWGDTYQLTLPGQYIDITNLTAGRYRLNVTADGAGLFIESNESDNRTWVDLHITPNKDPRIVAQGPSV
jgi:hypothetical protein